MFNGWYYGRTLAPIMVLDEAKLNEKLAEIAADVNQPAINAAVEVEGETAVYTPGQSGRALDVADARTRLTAVLTSLRPAQIELLVNQTAPAIYDNAPGAERIQRIIDGGPVTFYLPEPLDSEDLAPVALPPEQLRQWLRVEVTEQADGSLTHNVFLDENAARQWLAQYAEQIYREPVNARFYFDDATQELVLVSPHINGRELDIDATLEQLLAQVESPNRSVPFIVNEIVPTVHANATAAELGITELISEATTWFYGSSDARKRNISRSAANFYGIVIAPGEEFSYNKYLGTISEDDGYEEGLIIVGGQTIKGIGGGVCQVSTTVFQTVFWAGFPVTERWEHGYMLGYYNDGEGPGMDATVYDPIVDFKFINNTPYHLLIENYYNEEEESITFKFYSTSLGRTVEKEGPVFENIVDAPGPEEDVWTLDEDMAPGTVRQIDWATEGARVTVGRTVYNADGEIILQEDFVSNYIPWPNGYMYGPGVDAPDYSIPLED
jgi:vancomycin resistance protein YoaR